MRAEAQGVRSAADSRDVRGTTLPAVPAVAHGPFDEPDEVRDARSSIVKTVVGSIGLGLAVLIITLVLDDAKSDVARRLALAMAVTLALYGMVSLLVGRRLDAKIIRPRLVEGSVGRAIGIGTLCGAGAGITVGTLCRWCPANSPPTRTWSRSHRSGSGCPSSRSFSSRSSPHR